MDTYLYGSPQTRPAFRRKPATARTPCPEADEVGSKSPEYVKPVLRQVGGFATLTRGLLGRRGDSRNRLRPAA
ncbi:lasso RiPP family leader peptide-containing protein [Kibdelosporangium phytohabitans]|nr:lasso RiPP family leader peptide-containing protein [Kibdelosporangium phytohabitans]MBE1470705.1 hypothetical protein [Kibdelosporangium phytohabitans]